MQDDVMWNWARRVGTVPNGQLRVSDAERAEVTDALSKHYADGRLDETEMRDRMDQALAAKTRNELAGVLTDLPPLEPPVARPPRPRRLPSVLVVVGLVSIIAVTSSLTLQHVPWLLFVVIALLISRRRHWHRGRSMTGLLARRP